MRTEASSNRWEPIPSDYMVLGSWAGEHGRVGSSLGRFSSSDMYWGVWLEKLLGSYPTLPRLRQVGAMVARS